ncbi:hypothetical protein Zm00014a_012938, partial [Zea mays]
VARLWSKKIPLPSPSARLPCSCSSPFPAARQVLCRAKLAHLVHGRRAEFVLRELLCLVRPLFGPSSFSSPLPHSAVVVVARQADCVSCVAHLRSSSLRRSPSHCVRQHRRFPYPVLARFSARQRVLSARSALIPNRVVDLVVCRRVVKHVIPGSISTSPAYPRLQSKVVVVRASPRNPKNRVKTKLAAQYSSSARQIVSIGKSLPISWIHVGCGNGKLINYSV